MFGSTRSDEMTFLVRAGVPLDRAQIEAAEATAASRLQLAQLADATAA
jgi:hypothetical protein